MDYLYSLIWQYPILSVAQMAFMIWMLMDAYRRHVEPFWYLVIFFIPLAGSLVYFFAVKIHDYRGASLGSLFQRKVPLEELRYRTEQTPTLTNHLSLAERLITLHQFEEAAPHVQAALKQEPDHPTALYTMARCYKGQGQLSDALVHLIKLQNRDARYANFAGWHLLIETYSQNGQMNEALKECRELIRIAPTLQNQCLLAEHLLDNGLGDEAHSLLDKSLQEFAYAPGPIRRRNRPWAKKAAKLLKRIALENSSGPGDPRGEKN